MDSIKLTRMLIKLFAVLLIAWTAHTSPWVFTSYISGTNEAKSTLYFITSVLLPILFPFLVALGLWVFAGTISGKINPEEEQFSIDGFSEEKALKLGLFFLGTFVFIYAVVDLVSHLSYIYFQLTTKDHTVQAMYTYPDLIATIVELGLGLFIAFQRQGILRVVNKIRGRY